MLGSPENTDANAGRTDLLARVLLHELAGLLDGSARSLRLARAALSDESSDAVRTAQALNHLGAAESALANLTELVRKPAGDDAQHLSSIGRVLGAQPIHHAVAAAVDHVRPLAEQRGVRLDMRIDAEVMSAPPAPIYPAIVNALRNAVEASDGGDEVTICAAVDGATSAGAMTAQTVRIDVRDSGCGLAGVDRAKAFDLGYSTKSHGSGVGLALARDLARELGGDAELHDNAGGRGALLRITFPARRNEPSSPAGPSVDTVIS